MRRRWFFFVFWCVFRLFLLFKKWLQSLRLTKTRCIKAPSPAMAPVVVMVLQIHPATRATRMAAHLRITITAPDRAMGVRVLLTVILFRHQRNPRYTIYQG